MRFLTTKLAAAFSVLVIASNGLCQESVLSGSHVRVIELAAGVDRPDFEIEYVRLVDESVLEVSLENREDLPITLAGIIIFLGFTGHPVLVVGGMNDSDEIASQAKPGRSLSRIACMPDDNAPENYDIGMYTCVSHARLDPAEVSSVVVILSHAFTDDADRD